MRAAGGSHGAIRWGRSLSLALWHAADGCLGGAGFCTHAHVGFVIAWNWGDLADGEHTAIVYDDGVPVFERTFTVATFGTSFLSGAAGSCLVDHFPAPGDIARFTWNEGTQRLELDEIVGETGE